MDLIQQPVPRSDELVQALARPQLEREGRVRKTIWKVFAGLVLIAACVWFVPNDEGVIVEVFIGLVAGIFALVALIVRAPMGLAPQLVRDGVAYPATVDEIHGGRYGASITYRVSWQDAQGKERHKFTQAHKGGPRPTKEGTVLVCAGKKAVGIVMAGALYVV